MLRLQFHHPELRPCIGHSLLTHLASANSAAKGRHQKHSFHSRGSSHSPKVPRAKFQVPKGRRSPHETDLNCAIREFEEETDIKRNNFTVIHNTNPISETFFGSNQIHYCHKYYIAICNNSVNAELNLNSYQMIKEIGDIKWCTLDEAIAKIRPDNVEKREVLLKAGKIIRNFYPIFTSDEYRTTSGSSKKFNKQVNY
jgi:8-oxo-dGTP pyrophosphatase MutT (NUDIX family)